MSIKLVVKPSPIAGRGVFAEQDFKKGEIIFKPRGATIKYPSAPDWRIGANWFNVGPNTWRIADRGTLWNFLNHSCEPNAILKGSTAVVALHPIKTSQEVTIDYSSTEASSSQMKMTCHCQSPSCRRVIRSIQYLPEKLFRKYQRYIMPFLRKEYLQQKVYVGQTKNNAPTIFAKRPIKKNEVLFIVKGPIITYSRAPDYKIGFKWLGLGRNLWMIPLRHNPWWTMRHSCEPNVGLRGQTEVVAMRPIKANEEINIDDSVTEADPRWHVKCSCGSKTCRKTIRSIQYLPEKLFKKYKPYIPAFFRQVHKKRRHLLADVA